MEDSIFTKIVKGEVPCQKIYEDELTLAFLDLFPMHPGHTLVVPKKQIDHLWDLSDTDYQAVMETSKKVANRIREVLQPVRVGVHVIGTDVPHAHVHVFPFDSGEEYWQGAGGKAAEEDLDEMAAKLAF
jgi:histidine triad (HIT) family protein